MSKIVLNAPGSPVQIQIKNGVSSKTNKPYEYLHIQIGEYEVSANNFPGIFFRSPLEKREVERVLAEGASALLDD